jgi:hypothetical protein
LCHEISDQKVVATLKDCENDVQKKCRDIEPTSEACESIMAVYNRIRFTRMLLQALVQLYPAKSYSPNEYEMSEITKLLTSAIELLPAIKKTIPLGTEPDYESKFERLLNYS